MIPVEAVEAAAEVLAMASPEDWSGDQWANEKIDDSYREPWRKEARHILEASYPIMLSHEREETRLAHVDAVVNVETVDRLQEKLDAMEALADKFDGMASNLGMSLDARDTCAVAALHIRAALK